MLYDDMRMDVVLPLLVRCSSVLFACSHSYFRPGVLEVLPSPCSLSTAIPFVFLRRIVLAALVFSLSATVLPCAALLAWLCCAARAEFASRCCLYMCAARLCPLKCYRPYAPCLPPSHLCSYSVSCWRAKSGLCLLPCCHALRYLLCFVSLHDSLVCR